MQDDSAVSKARKCIIVTADAKFDRLNHTEVLFWLLRSSRDCFIGLESTHRESCILSISSWIAEKWSSRLLSKANYDQYCDYCSN